MELNWSTFVLEIINFLVLVWILKRFLYKPVLDVIAKRRAEIEQRLADAEALQSDAKALQDRYENRLTDWDAERQRARDELAREIEEERANRLTEIRAVVEQEREKAEVAETHRLEGLRRQAEETALTQGARFAARLLEQAAGPDLDARLFELLMSELSSKSPEHAATLSAGVDEAPEAILVSSAFALSDEQRARLSDTLARVTRLNVPVRFDQNPALLAGLRITIGPIALGMNLKDELEGFAGSTRDDR